MDPAPALEQDTRTRTQLLEAIAQGWLLFHGGDWGPEQEAAWAQLGLGEACTSKALGDATRRALAMPELPPLLAGGGSWGPEPVTVGGLPLLQHVARVAQLGRQDMRAVGDEMRQCLLPAQVALEHARPDLLRRSLERLSALATALMQPVPR